MPENKPYISVVICTYNRAAYIGQSLACLFEQEYPAEKFEVIVVDNNSTDGTAKIVSDFQQKHPYFPMRYVFEPDKGLSFARNRGIKESAGEIIAYIDDDAEAVKDYLKEIDIFFKNKPEAQGAGGRVIPKYEMGKEPAWMNQYLNGFVGLVDFGETITRYNESMKYPAGCNMMYKKAILAQAGGFNNQLTFRSDDKFIYFQVKNISDQVYYLPHAKVYHNIDSNRLNADNFRKLYLKTGNEEKVRLRSEGNKLSLLKKLLELCFKFCASFILYLIFLAKGHEIKGRYVLKAQWYTLQGFLKKSVFVR